MAIGPGGHDPSSFPYSQATWSAVIDADRAYYDRVQEVTGPQGAAVAFPGYGAGRRFQLRGSQMRIGRRSASRGLAPEIDLSGPPADPGISRLHAVLIAAPAGHWAVLDPESANGTLVNGAEIAIGQQVSLQDGDRINLGAWTAITLHRDDHQLTTEPADEEGPRSPRRSDRENNRLPDEVLGVGQYR
jgi:pSer/pThr/pTyr-binding forkhead associated (FHA) protein